MLSLRDEEIALDCVTTADLNGDGLEDLIASDAGAGGGFDLPGRIWTAMNEGGMRFSTPTWVGTGDLYPKEIATADMDGDGDLDLVAWCAELWPGQRETFDRLLLVFLNDGHGALSMHGEVVLGAFALEGPHRSALALADFDGDGTIDAAATSGPFLEPGIVTILANDGRGTLSPVQEVDVGCGPDALVASDFDGDGDADLALYHNRNVNCDLEQAYATVLQNDGGVFSVIQTLVDPSVRGENAIAAADLDGDGDLDLITPDIVANVCVHLNDGGVFQPASKHSVLEHVTGLVCADFDGDGRVDVFASDYDRERESLLLNVRCEADVNADGVLDILDFVAFQTAFVGRNPNADCDGDGVLSNPLDFVCFQRAFSGGCE